MRRSPAVPAPGWPANDVIRSIPRPGREGRAPILRCQTIACWAAPAPGENFIRLSFLDADERDKLRQMLFREGLVWLPAGRDLSHDRSAASRRAYPASIAWMIRAQVVGIRPPLRLPQNRMSGDKLTHGQALGNRFNARLRGP